MNAVFLSGTLVSDAVVRGKQTKVLAFVIETKQSNGEGKDYIAHIPCVAFNPDEQLEKDLTKGKGLHLVLQGRVNGNPNDDDERRPKNVEVVAFNKSIIIIDPRQTSHWSS